MFRTIPQCHQNRYCCSVDEIQTKIWVTSESREEQEEEMPKCRTIRIQLCVDVILKDHDPTRAGKSESHHETKRTHSTAVLYDVLKGRLLALDFFLKDAVFVER